MKTKNGEKETPKMSSIDVGRFNLPKVAGHFLTSQKRDHMFEGIGDEIGYTEEEEDIAAGKASTTKFLKDLKNRTKNVDTSENGASSNDKSEDVFPQRAHNPYDFIGIDTRPLKGKFEIPEPTGNQIDEEKILRNRMAKQSLLAGLPDRVKNFKVEPKLIKEEIKEVPSQKAKEPSPEPFPDYTSPQEQFIKQESSYEESSLHESPEPETLMIPTRQMQKTQDVVMDEVIESIQSSEKVESDSESELDNDIIIPDPPKPRRMSFEHPQPLLFDDDLPDGEMFDEMNILQDPNTCRPRNNRPRLSRANDDIELMRRKREAKTRRIMGFLYAGDAPQRNAIRRSSKYNNHDVNVGSDYTPEKEEEPHHEQMKSPLITSRNEEEKEFSSLVREAHHATQNMNPVQSEVMYDNKNPLVANVSNKSVYDTVRSESLNAGDEDRAIEGANLLQRVKNNLQSHQMPAVMDEEDIDVIKEVVSDQHSSHSSIIGTIKSSSKRSVVESAVMSSDRSSAPPASPLAKSEKSVISQVKYNNEGEDSYNSNSDILVDSGTEKKESPVKTRNQRNTEMELRSAKYKGSRQFIKRRK